MTSRTARDVNQLYTVNTDMPTWSQFILNSMNALAVAIRDEKYFKTVYLTKFDKAKHDRACFILPLQYDRPKPNDLIRDTHQMGIGIFVIATGKTTQKCFQNLIVACGHVYNAIYHDRTITLNCDIAQALNCEPVEADPGQTRMEATIELIITKRLKMQF